MNECGVAELIERFADLPDRRVEGRTDHDVLDIVVLALRAVMSGNSTACLHRHQDADPRRHSAHGRRSCP